MDEDKRVEGRKVRASHAASQLLEVLGESS